MLTEYNETREQANQKRNTAMVESYRAGSSMRDVAAQFGLSMRQTHTILHGAGVSRRPGQPPLAYTSPEQKREYETLRRYIGASEARKAMGL